MHIEQNWVWKVHTVVGSLCVTMAGHCYVLMTGTRDSVLCGYKIYVPVN